MTTPASSLTQFSLSVAYTLHLWPALTLAVTSHWGGPDSSDKRDWLAGSIVELFEEDPSTDAYDVESRLLQVMLDEFEVAVDDESAKEIADGIVRLWGECCRGEFGGVEGLKRRWEERKGKGGDGGEKLGFHRVESGEGDQETDGEGEDWEDEDGDGDVDMEEAPQLVRKTKEKVEPVVDEEGFTTVVSKKKR